MKTFVVAMLFIIGVLIPISCEDKALLVNCSECLNDKPYKVTIKIRITSNSENPTVPITVYLGNIEEGNILVEDIGYDNYYKSDNYYYFEKAEFGQYYTVVAKYQSNGRTIRVVDGKMLKVRLDNSSCDRSCYVIEGDKFDVRLK
jgi:hypothetical protein